MGSAFLDFKIHFIQIANCDNKKIQQAMRYTFEVLIFIPYSKKCLELMHLESYTFQLHYKQRMENKTVQGMYQIYLSDQHEIISFEYNEWC